MNTMLFVTPVIAAVCAVLLLILSARTLLRRRATGIGIGTSAKGEDDVQLSRAIRAHGNFVEYTPTVLILMMLMEFRGGSPTTLAIIGCIFIVGRVIHAVGISREPENYRFRVIGMVTTLGAIIALTTRLLLSYL